MKVVVAQEMLLCIEVYKTLNSLNSCFMQELFKPRETNRNVRNKYKLNFDIPVVNQVFRALSELSITARKCESLLKEY